MSKIIQFPGSSKPTVAKQVQTKNDPDNVEFLDPDVITRINEFYTDLLINSITSSKNIFSRDKTLIQLLNQGRRFEDPYIQRMFETVAVIGTGVTSLMMTSKTALIRTLTSVFSLIQRGHNFAEFIYCVSSGSRAYFDPNEIKTQNIFASVVAYPLGTYFSRDGSDDNFRSFETNSKKILRISDYRFDESRSEGKEELRLLENFVDYVSTMTDSFSYFVRRDRVFLGAIIETEEFVVKVTLGFLRSKNAFTVDLIDSSED